MCKGIKVYVNTQLVKYKVKEHISYGQYISICIKLFFIYYCLIK